MNYSELEEKYINTVIIRKEGFFYSVRNKSAYVITNLFDYKLGKQGKYDFSGFPIKILDRILEVLDEKNINYMVISKENVIAVKEYVDNQFEVYSIKKVLENESEKVNVQSINKEKQNIENIKSDRVISKCNSYKRLEEEYPNSVIIRKERFFYVARNESAQILNEKCSCSLSKFDENEVYLSTNKLHKVIDKLNTINQSYVVLRKGNIEFIKIFEIGDETENNEVKLHIGDKISLVNVDTGEINTYKLLSVTRENLEMKKVLE